MSRLLEILGRAIAIDTADLIWHWLHAVPPQNSETQSTHIQQLDKVIELIGNMKFESAEQQVRFYLFENPGCVRGRMAAAAICFHNNKLEAAIEELNSVYFRQPNNTMALYALGYCHERLGREQEAIEFYQDCLKFKNYLQLPAERLAAIYFKNGRFEKAIQQYELLKTEYPEDLSARVMLGHMYIAAGRYDDASQTFDMAILMHPDNFADQEDDIELLLQQGQADDALERCEELVQTQPHRTDLLLKRADILTMLGATSEAVAQYEDIVRFCPDFLEATIKLGTLYLQLEQDQLAAHQFNRAVEVNDSIVDAYIGLATSQKMAGHRSQALATLSLAGAIQPNTCLLFAEMATLHFRAALSRGHSNTLDDRSALIAAAINAHRLQIAQKPCNPDIHYRLGILLAATGQLSPATASFKNALDINPLFARAQSKLAICHYEAGNHDDALANLIPATNLDQDTLNIHYKTAMLYCDKVKFASSMLNLERNLEKSFAASDPTVNISLALQNLGLIDRAIATWESVAETAAQAGDYGRADL